MFGKNRKYKKAVNALGPHIHQQIVKAMEVKQDVFSSPEEVAFTAGYLTSLIWETLDKRGCKDADVQEKMLKHVCNGVIPGRLWDIVERGKALGSHPMSKYAASAIQAYKLGTGCGIYDGDTEAVPDNLRLFLVGENVMPSWLSQS